jgi:hypothetical protein
MKGCRREGGGGVGWKLPSCFSHLEQIGLKYFKEFYIGENFLLTFVVLVFFTSQQYT